MRPDRYVPLLFLGLTLLGCKKTPPPFTMRFHLNTMNSADQDALVAGTYPMPLDALLVVDFNRRNLLTRDLVSRDVTVEMATLRNPGAFVFIVHGPPARYLTAAERSELEGLARSVGASVVSRVPIRYGLDGRTPVVMRPIGRWSPESSAKPTDTKIQLRFPSLKQAQEAACYIDKAYQVTTRKDGKDAALVASIRIPNGAVVEEGFAFEPLAKRFGGKLEWTGTSGVAPNYEAFP